MTRPLTALLAALLAGPAAAQTVWTAAGGGNWDDPANWANNTPPGAASSVVFGGSLAGGGPFVVLLDGARQADGLAVDGAAGPVRLRANGSATAAYRTGSSATSYGSGLRAVTADLFVEAPLELVGNAFLEAGNGRTVGLSQVRVASGSTATLTFGQAVASTGRFELSDGLDLSAGTGNLTLNGADSAVLRLTADQTWAVGNGRRVFVGRDPTTGNLPAVDLGPAGRTLTVAVTNPGSAFPYVQFNAPLTGGGGITLTGDGPGAGALLLGGPNGFGFGSATGPLVVTGGTLIPNQTGWWAGTSVSVSGGQVLPGDNNALPAATVLTLSGTGAYNLGVPNFTTGSLAGAVPRDRTQTFASVTHSGSGAFNTAGVAVTVSGTYANTAAGPLTVQPAGTLAVNRLDLGAVPGTGGGAVTVQSDFLSGVGVRTGTLSVGAGGLNLAGRTITLAGTGNGISQLALGGDVTAAGPSFITAAPNGQVRLGSPGRVFDVAAGGVLTVAAQVVDPAQSYGGGLDKRGAGELRLAAANTYPGATRVTAGRLVAAGPVALPGNLVLSGGTFSTAGGANGAGVEQVPSGQLYVTASSTLELGTGSHRLKFLAFGTGGFGGGANLPAGTLLTVTGWQGQAYGGGTAGDIVFTDNGGLGAGTLSRIQFDGFPTGAVLIPYTGLGGGLELVPVPEPAAVLGLAAVGLGAVRLARRRILAG